MALQRQGELADLLLSLIRRPAADGIPLYLTRLEARMSPGEMNQDIHDLGAQQTFLTLPDNAVMLRFDNPVPDTKTQILSLSR